MSGKYRRPLILFIFLIFTISFFWKIIFLGYVFLPQDNLYQYQPWKTYQKINPHNKLLSDPVLLYYPYYLFFKDSLTQGYLPLWNPYILCGVPFVAESQAGIFYPFHYLFLIGNLAETFGYLIMLHILLMQIFTYLFLREIKITRAGSILGATGFCFGGFVVGHMAHPMMINVITWLPLLLWIIEKIFKEQKNRYIYIIIGAAAFAVQLLAGHPEISFYIIFTFFLYAIFKSLIYYFKTGDMIYPLKNMLSVAAIIILGFIIGSIQLVPTAKYVLSYSVRKGTIDYSRYIRDAMNLRHLILFIIPDFLGNPLHNNYIGKLNYTEYNGYIGIIPLILAFFGIFNHRLKERMFFILLAGLSLAFILGTPLCRMLYYLVPGFSQLRSPFRFLSVYTFSASILSAIGFDYVFTKDDGVKNLTKVLFILLTIVGAAMMFAYIAKDAVINWSGMLTSYFDNSFYYYELRNILRLFLLLLLFYILSLAYVKLRLRTAFFKIIIILFIFIDLFTWGSCYNSFVPKKLFFKPEAINFLVRDNSIYRISGFSKKEAILPSDTNMYWQLQDIRGYYSFIYRPYVEFMNLIEPQNFAATRNIVAEFTESGSLDSQLFDLLNIKYILSDQIINSDKFDLVYDREIKIYKNRNVLPRVFIVHNVKVIKDKNDQLAYLKSREFDPSRAAVVEIPPPFPSLEENGHQFEGSARSDITGNDTEALKEEIINITSYKPNEVSIEARPMKEGLLVFSDINYPGWKVYVDGKENPVNTVDYIFRGVYLTKGDHRVIFNFRPKEFKMGILFTSIGLLLVFVIGIYNLAKNRRRLGKIKAL